MTRRRRKKYVLYYRPRVCWGDVLFYGTVILLAVFGLCLIAWRWMHGLSSIVN